MHSSSLKIRNNHSKMFEASKHLHILELGYLAMGGGLTKSANDNENNNDPYEIQSSTWCNIDSPDSCKRNNLELVHNKSHSLSIRNKVSKGLFVCSPIRSTQRMAQLAGDDALVKYKKGSLCNLVTPPAGKENSENSRKDIFSGGDDEMNKFVISPEVVAKKKSSKRKIPLNGRVRKIVSRDSFETCFGVKGRDLYIKPNGDADGGHGGGHSVTLRHKRSTLLTNIDEKNRIDISLADCLVGRKDTLKDGRHKMYNKQTKKTRFWDSLKGFLGNKKQKVPMRKSLVGVSLTDIDVLNECRFANKEPRPSSQKPHEALYSPAPVSVKDV